jgi:DNA modification methylase
VRTPKLVYPKKGKCAWYEYYAGYSREFVSDALTRFSLQSNDVVLDPWNGSGTTTEVARQMGCRGIGIDINPAMVIVSKARVLDPSVTASLQSICDDVIRKSYKSRQVIKCESDSLLHWLGQDSVASIRRLDQAIQQLLIGSGSGCMLRTMEPFENVSTLAAFYYVALFRTVRGLLRSFYSSNPTWVKVAQSGRFRLRPSQDTIVKAFQHHVSEMIDGLSVENESASTLHQHDCSIKLGSSNKLPVNDSAISAVVTSPPYCTRIDYAVATLPELAVMGYGDEEIRLLRQDLIGTPTIWKEQPKIDSNWGSTCLDFLEAVSHHDSQASSTYYLKNFVQYFSAINSSLKEINRVLRNDGHCALVVQDSYYKDVHNDLASMFTEMGATIGWSLSDRFDFDAGRRMVQRNPRAKQYRSDRSVTESVLVFRKPRLLVHA